MHEKRMHIISHQKPEMWYNVANTVYKGKDKEKKKEETTY